MDALEKTDFSKLSLRAAPCVSNWSSGDEVLLRTMKQFINTFNQIPTVGACERFYLFSIVLHIGISLCTFVEVIFESFLARNTNHIHHHATCPVKRMQKHLNLCLIYFMFYFRILFPFYTLKNKFYLSQTPTSFYLFQTIRPFLFLRNIWMTNKKQSVWFVPVWVQPVKKEWVPVFSVVLVCVYDGRRCQTSLAALCSFCPSFIHQLVSFLSWRVSLQICLCPSLPVVIHNECCCFYCILLRIAPKAE